jgi:hypothetical protein
MKEIRASVMKCSVFLYVVRGVAGHIVLVFVLCVANFCALRDRYTIN